MSDEPGQAPASPGATQPTRVLRVSHVPLRSVNRVQREERAPGGIAVQTNPSGSSDASSLIFRVCFFFIELFGVISYCHPRVPVPLQAGRCGTGLFMGLFQRRRGCGAAVGAASLRVLSKCPRAVRCRPQRRAVPRGRDSSVRAAPGDTHDVPLLLWARFSVASSPLRRTVPGLAAAARGDSSALCPQRDGAASTKPCGTLGNP